MNVKLIGGCLIFILWSLAGRALAQAQDEKLTSLPNSAWQVLTDAQGITVGGLHGAKARIQVVFDVNAPYDAKLFERLQHSFPDTAVRWVPVAYIHADSAAIATAILVSNNPPASLRKNFDNYDYGRQHGGYPLPKDSPQVVANSFQPVVRKHWIKNWGGYTPITIFRTAQDRVLKAVGLLDQGTFARIVSRTKDQ